MSGNAAPLYDEDFVRWTEEQAAALRQAAELATNLSLDWENLEIGSGDALATASENGQGDKEEIMSGNARALRRGFRPLDRGAGGGAARRREARHEPAARLGEPRRGDRQLGPVAET